MANVEVTHVLLSCGLIVDGCSKFDTTVLVINAVGGAATNDWSIMVFGNRNFRHMGSPSLMSL